MLSVNNVSVRFKDTVAVSSVSFTLDKGQWLMLAGPNGAGKSTLIRALSRGISYDGAILLNGADIRTVKPALFARNVGVLSQHPESLYPYTVKEIVALGRYAYRKGFFGSGTGEDEEHIERALALTGMRDMRDRKINELSGGEIQRAFLSQVFAQDPALLILDEPANHLDLIYQKQIFSLITDWLQAPGRAVISVVHDLSLALKYGTHAVLMDCGRCVSFGTAREALSPDNLKAVYRMDVSGWMRELLSQWDNLPKAEN